MPTRVGSTGLFCSESGERLSVTSPPLIGSDESNTWFFVPETAPDVAVTATVTLPSSSKPVSRPIEVWKSA